MELKIMFTDKKYEIVHYASDNLFVASKKNKITFITPNFKKTLKLPKKGLKCLFIHLRILRRLLRLDKCNVVPIETDNPDSFVIIKDGIVYYYSLKRNKFHKTLSLKNCRNVLHQSIAVINSTVFFGEYGSNPQRNSVPLYKSDDKGQSWRQIYTFPEKSIKHIHGCYWDVYEQKLWTLTGDFEDENYMMVSDLSFDNIEWIGDGSQNYRAVSVFFQNKYVYWIMDSQLETNYLFRLDRKKRVIERLISFPGPVWYIKQTIDNYYFAATTYEKGSGVHTEYAHIFVSDDLINWNSLIKFDHDKLPLKYFKNGVIGFADGPQKRDSIYIFGEALKGFDGKMAKLKLVKNDA